MMTMRPAGLLSAGQHTSDAASYQRLQRRFRIGGDVELAVEGDGRRPRRCDQRLRAGLVHRALRRQTAYHHAGNAQFPQPRGIVEHRGEFGIEIQQITAARANDDVERDGCAGQRLAYYAIARCQQPSNRLAQSSTRSAPPFCAASRPSMPSTQTSILGVLMLSPSAALMRAL
jgi:hypothetical protein